MTTDLLNRKKIRVGVLRGGPSSEYEISLKTGNEVLRSLPEKYHPIDILISKEGEWHLDGASRNPEKVLKQIDVVFNALHGKYGEDGKIQSVLESHNIPYTGSGSFPSSICMNKELLKKFFLAQGYKTPKYVVLGPKENTRQRIVELFQSFSQPSIIKPIASGSSIGVTFANDFKSFKEGIENAFRHGGKALIEEYIPGKEIMCSVLTDSGGKNAYSLYPVEVVRPENKKFFDYESRSSNYTKKHSPASISPDEQKALANIALTLHGALGLSHYSGVDFILSPTRGAYILEINTLPGLTKDSLYTKSLEATGIKFDDFLDHVLTLALAEKPYN